jgi:hypothetical protein
MVIINIGKNCMKNKTLIVITLLCSIFAVAANAYITFCNVNPAKNGSSDAVSFYYIVPEGSMVREKTTPSIAAGACYTDTYYYSFYSLSISDVTKSTPYTACYNNGGNTMNGWNNGVDSIGCAPQ